jgi:hypothetical protein
MPTTTVHAHDTGYTTCSLKARCSADTRYHTLLPWPVERRPDPHSDSPLRSVQLVQAAGRCWHKSYRWSGFGSTFIASFRVVYGCRIGYYRLGKVRTASGTLRRSFSFFVTVLFKSSPTTRVGDHKIYTALPEKYHRNLLLRTTVSNS